MKLKELMDAGTVTDPKVGYVGAYPYAEVVCGYTAFLLGIQTQVPEAYMEVQYTNSWYDPVAEGEAANALMARGCVIIGQHADSTGAPSAVQAQKDAGSVVYSVGYNIDMLEVAPTAALTSSQNNWSVLYRDTLEKFIAGEEVPVDYAVGISEDAVDDLQAGAWSAPRHPGGRGRRLVQHQGRQPEGVRHLQVHLPARCRPGPIRWTPTVM